MYKKAFVHLSSDVSETSDNADQQGWNLKWELRRQDLGKWWEKRLRLVNHWVAVKAGLRCEQNEAVRAGQTDNTHRMCLHAQEVSLWLSSTLQCVCAVASCTDRDSHRLEDLLTTVHFGQDVGGSPRFILLLQTQGGPHQAGKLHGTTLLFFQQHRFSPLKCIWIQM